MEGTASTHDRSLNIVDELRSWRILSPIGLSGADGAADGLDKTDENEMKTRFSSMLHRRETTVSFVSSPSFCIHPLPHPIRKRHRRHSNSSMTLRLKFQSTVKARETIQKAIWSIFRRSESGSAVMCELVGDGKMVIYCANDFSQTLNLRCIGFFTIGWS